MELNSLDFIVIGIYALALAAIALFVSHEPDGKSKTTDDYFLASKALPWWAIGASLIAANISAEQIIGQSGQGYAVGIAIAAYEWQAAIVLLVVAKYFLPIFLRRGIYTMPQFLDQRFGGGVKSLMSVYWIALYTAVNLTTVLWLGGLAIGSVTGFAVFPAMAGLAVFAMLYSLYGGLKAVAMTDIIQVVVLLLGGCAISWIVLDLVSGGNGAVAGFGRLFEEAPGHFEMLLAPEHPAYNDLPGIWTLLGGLWVLHFSYWGFNQYIIQRALAAESLPEAQKGLVFAALLKLFVPVIVVIPGIAAIILAQQGVLNQAVLDPSICQSATDSISCGKPDRVYGELMVLVPAGLRGLVFAALIAAIVSSLASMMNSISTIFTLDLYRSARPGRSEHHYVSVGRISAFIAMVFALILARPFIGGFESGFQAVQEYTGFIAPGVVAIFLLGFFYSRSNVAGAYAVLVSSLAMSIVMKLLAGDLPFVIRIWAVFVVCLLIGVAASEITRGKIARRDQYEELPGLSFKTSTSFNLAAVVIFAIFVSIYVVF